MRWSEIKNVILPNEYDKYTLPLSAVIGSVISVIKNDPSFLLYCIGGDRLGAYIYRYIIPWTDKKPEEYPLIKFIQKYV